MAWVQVRQEALQRRLPGKTISADRTNAAMALLEAELAGASVPIRSNAPTISNMPTMMSLTLARGCNREAAN
jgi:hypothetical protein